MANHFIRFFLAICLLFSFLFSMSASLFSVLCVCPHTSPSHFVLSFFSLTAPTLNSARSHFTSSSRLGISICCLPVYSFSSYDILPSYPLATDIFSNGSTCWNNFQCVGIPKILGYFCKVAKTICGRGKESLPTK